MSHVEDEIARPSWPDGQGSGDPFTALESRAEQSRLQLIPHRGGNLSTRSLSLLTEIRAEIGIQAGAFTSWLGVNLDLLHNGQARLAAPKMGGLCPVPDGDSRRGPGEAGQVTKRLPLRRGCHPVSRTGVEAVAQWTVRMWRRMENWTACTD